MGSSVVAGELGDGFFGAGVVDQVLAGCGGPMPVMQDRGDLRGRPARQLQPQRGGLGEQLRVSAHRPGIRPRRRPERRQPPGPPGPQPPVDRAPRIPPRRPVRMGVGAGGDLPHQRAALGGGQRRTPSRWPPARTREDQPPGGLAPRPAPPPAPKTPHPAPGPGWRTAGPSPGLWYAGHRSARPLAGSRTRRRPPPRSPRQRARPKTRHRCSGSRAVNNRIDSPSRDCVRMDVPLVPDEIATAILTWFSLR